MPTALVIGGGVAGPATALFLRRIGWRVSVHEAAAAPGDHAGSFLNLASNGLSVLGTLGLRDGLLADAHPCPRMVMWSGRGKRLGEVPNGPAGDPARGSAVVRRAHLHAMLRDAVQRQDIPLHLGHRLVGIADGDGGVRAEFADGSTAEADILVGCDGVGSPTRRWIDPDAPAPAYTGLVGVGGYARTPAAAPTPGTQNFLFGRRSFFGWLVRDDGLVYWFANVTRPAEPDRAALRATSTAEWLAELRALHAGDPAPVPQILDGVVGEIGGYAVHDLGHVPRWSRGRVIAIGDAVHATSPSAGQGASQALEDGVTLARCLRDLPDTRSAFTAFERERRPRAEQVVAYARAISDRKTVSRNPVAVLARDLMLPVFLRRAAQDTTVNWLYDHEIPWDARVAQADEPVGDHGLNVVG